MDDFDRLAGLVSRIRLAHQISGRVRLKLTGAIPHQSIERFKTSFSHFSDALHDIPGIRSIRVNVLARSCTVEYDPQSIPDNAWTDVLAGIRSREALSLVKRLGKKYREIVGEPL